MSEQSRASTSIWDAPAGAYSSPAIDDHPGVPSAATAAQRPEVAIGAAFAGGVLAAIILRRLGG